MRNLIAGNIVYLLGIDGVPITDKDGNPCEHQVVSVHKEISRVGLVSYYGEYVGRYDLSRVQYVAPGPLFSSSQYNLGDIVIWIDTDGVYEGVVDSLYKSSAKMKNVKKLLPVDHVVKVPYWKISDKIESNVEDTSSELIDHRQLSQLKGENLPMSTKANIILRNEVTIRREIYLYQHSDAHPNNMTLYLAEMLRDSYVEFKELGDADWFLNPSKLASFLVVKSVPKISDEVRDVMKKLPEAARYQLESAYFLGMPSLLVENNRVSNCNYEYIITLSEDVDNDFFGYEIEINKMNANKLIATVMKHKENLLRDTPTPKKKSKAVTTNDIQ